MVIASPYFAFYDVTTYPRPTQQPHPPVWVAAAMSRQSFAWVGSQGFGLLVTPLLTEIATLKERCSIYRESFEATPASPAPRIALSQPLFVAASDAAAIETGDRYLERYLSVWQSACTSWDR